MSKIESVGEKQLVTVLAENVSQRPASLIPSPPVDCYLEAEGHRFFPIPPSITPRLFLTPVTSDGGADRASASKEAGGPAGQPTPEEIQRLIGRLSDAELDVRRAAVEALLPLTGDAEVRQALENCPEIETDLRIRAILEEALNSPGE